jgi:hypothetical protein
MAAPGAPAGPPALLRDLAWDLDRARRFAEQAAALYAEPLERLGQRMDREIRPPSLRPPGGGQTPG